MSGDKSFLHDAGGGSVRFITAWKHLNTAQGADPVREITDEEKIAVFVTPGTNLETVVTGLRQKGITAASTGISFTSIGSGMSITVQDATLDEVKAAIVGDKNLIADPSLLTAKSFEEIPKVQGQAKR